MKRTVLGLVLSLVLGTASFVQEAVGGSLKPGDIVVAGPGGLYVIDPVTNAVTMLSNLGMRGVAVDDDGTIVAVTESTEPASIVRFDPETGSLATVLSFPTGTVAWGIAIDPDGNYLVTNVGPICCPGPPGSLDRVDSAGSTAETLTADNRFMEPVGVAVEPGGTILIADYNARTLFRWDPATGELSGLATFFPSGSPSGVTVTSAGEIIVVDFSDAQGGVYRVDASGTVTALAAGENRGMLAQSTSVAIEESGGILVADFYPGAVIRVDPVTGEQAVLATEEQVGRLLGIAIFKGPAGPMPMTIDIKPGSFPNSINLSSAGVVPVAILGSSTFDATTVDPATVALAGASVKLIGKGTKYSCSTEDVNADGFVDLVCHVMTAQFMIEPGDSVAVLEAQTFDGLAIRGQDSIRVVPD